MSCDVPELLQACTAPSPIQRERALVRLASIIRSNGRHMTGGRMRDWWAPRRRRLSLSKAGEPLRAS